MLHLSVEPLSVLASFALGIQQGSDRTSPLGWGLWCVGCLSLLPADPMLQHSAENSTQELLDLEKPPLSAQWKKKNYWMNIFHFAIHNLKDLINLCEKQF